MTNAEMIDALAEGFIDQTLFALMDGITNLAFEIDRRLLILKHDLSDRFNDWLSAGNHALFLGILVIGLPLVIYGVSILVTGIGGATFIKTSVSLFQGMPSAYKYTVWLKLIRGFHGLVQELSPRYKKMVVALKNTYSTLSDMLGFPLSTISSLMSGMQSYIFAVDAMLGIDKDQSHLRWLSVSTQWVNEMNNKFETYVKDPGKAWQWLEDNAMDKMQEDILKFNIAQQERMLGHTSAINQLFSNLTKVRKTAEGMIDSLPDIISETMDETWNPIFDKYDDTIGVWINLVEDITDITIPILEDLLDQSIKDQKEFEAKIQLRVNTVWNLFGFDRDSWEKQRKLIHSVSQEVMLEENQKTTIDEVVNIFKTAKQTGLKPVDVFEPTDTYNNFVIQLQPPPDLQAEPWYKGLE